MITWIIGEPNTGKTTLAYKIQEEYPNTIVLDRDEIMRTIFRPNYDEGLISIAFLAKILSDQGFDVVACGIPQDRQTLANITKICNPEWIEL